jgi:AcrR family transcriptional regulator
MPRTVKERADIVPLLVEVFRDHGYEGASLAVIGERTGLGKGSLYNFFPGGKEEMAEAALAHIGDWFDRSVFRPLRPPSEPREGILRMLAMVEDYFHGGERICLVGALALARSRDRFGERISAYFRIWHHDLAKALVRAGAATPAAQSRAEEALAAIQGTLVLARALDDTAPFDRMIARLRGELTAF